MNAFRVGVKILLPILLLPIITKALGAEKLGLVEYATTIVSYFVLFATLGVHNYGSREVASNRNNKALLSKTISELLILLIFVSFCSLLVYNLTIFLSPKFRSEWVLYLIIGLQILFTIPLSGEWIYEGFENQKFITVRVVLTNTLSAMLIVFFIKSSNDYLIYAAILSLPFILNIVINFYYIRKSRYFSFVAINELQPFRHLSKVLTPFAAQISALIYTQSGIVIIGFFDTMFAVSYYAIAAKIFILSSSFLSAFSGTILPRLTYYYANKDYKSYHLLGNNVLKGVLIFGVFAFSVIFSLADSIVSVLAGIEFERSIDLLRILSFALIGSCLSYFFGIIILYSQRKDVKFLRISFIIAILNVTLNLLLYRTIGLNGIAITTVISEFLCFLLIFYTCRKDLEGIELINFDNLKIFISGFLSVVSILLLSKYIVGDLVRIVFGVTFGGFVYLLMLLFLKNSLILSSIDLIRKRIKK